MRKEEEGLTHLSITNLMVVERPPLRVHCIQLMQRKGSGVPSLNPWASSRSVERTMKLQSGVCWNNVEARASTSIILLKVRL